MSFRYMRVISILAADWIKTNHSRPKGKYQLLISSFFSSYFLAHSRASRSEENVWQTIVTVRRSYACINGIVVLIFSIRLVPAGKVDAPHYKYRAITGYFQHDGETCWVQRFRLVSFPIEPFAFVSTLKTL